MFQFQAPKNHLNASIQETPRDPKKPSQLHEEAKP